MGLIGLISIQLLPCAKEIVGIDISEGMVDQYNAAVTKEEISPETMHAIRLNILEADADSGAMLELISDPFDVIVVSPSLRNLTIMNVNL